MISSSRNRASFLRLGRLQIHFHSGLDTVNTSRIVNCDVVVTRQRSANLDRLHPSTCTPGLTPVSLAERQL